MPPLLAALHAKGILTDDLTVPGEAGAHQKKYMGVARWERMINKSSTWGGNHHLRRIPGSNSLHRRLDIILVPW